MRLFAECAYSGTNVAAIVKAQVSGTYASMAEVTQDQESNDGVDIKCSEITRKSWWKKPFYLKISLDGGKIFSTKPVKGYSELSWNDTFLL